MVEYAAQRGFGSSTFEVVMKPGTIWSELMVDMVQCIQISNKHRTGRGG